MNRIIVFLREVRTEMTKVSWPSRTQLMRYTGVVLGLCLFIALYLGGLDALFASVLNRLIVP
jgi:preprotein translocase subunit SecE